MYFYLVYDKISDPILSCKKLGITSRHLPHRLDEYRTANIHNYYYLVAAFNCSKSELLRIEYNCLVATRRYMTSDRILSLVGDTHKNSPSMECRYDVSNEILWEICTKYFPSNYRILEPDELKFCDCKLTSKLNAKHFSTYDELMTCNISEPIHLRPHQDLNILINYFNTNKKGILHMAPGTGKTKYALAFINSQLTSKTYIVVGVPSLLLKAQWETEIRKHFVGKKSQISVILYRNYNISEKSIDYLILDECHRVSIDDNKDMKSREILKASMIYQLGLTATPIFSSRPGGNNDKSLFGSIIHTITIRDAIEQKLITNYNINIVRIEESAAINIKTICNIEDDPELEFIIATGAVLRMFSDNLITKTLIYCNKISDAKIIDTIISKIIASGIYSLPDINHFTLNGGNNSKYRKEKINEFISAKYAIMTSVYLFGEGVDLPCVDSICCASNMQSTVRIVQGVFRGSRLVPNTDKINNIIIPIVANTDWNDNRFKKVHTVINQIETSDKGVFDTMHIVNTSGNKLVIKKSNHTLQETKELDLDLSILESIKIEVTKSRTNNINTFIRRCHARNIKNQSDYRKNIKSGEYSNDFPFNPESKFPGFSWRMLENKSLYYTYEECYERISELITLHPDILDLSRAEKLKKLNNLDSKIPDDLDIYTNKVFDMLEYDID
jgi:superfamily II DNA or RNA helicase